MLEDDVRDFGLVYRYVHRAESKRFKFISMC
jgi:hypothetical protein